MGVKNLSVFSPLIQETKSVGPTMTAAANLAIGSGCINLGTTSKEVKMLVLVQKQVVFVWCSSMSNVYLLVVLFVWHSQLAAVFITL